VDQDVVAEFRESESFQSVARQKRTVQALRHFEPTPVPRNPDLVFDNQAKVPRASIEFSNRAKSGRLN